MSADTLAVLAVGVALAGLMLTLFRDLKGDLRELRRETRQELAELRREVVAQGERLSRIEGAVLGPWRPDPPEKEAAEG